MIKSVLTSGTAVLSLLVQSAIANPVLLQDLPPLKDPTVWQYAPEKNEWLLVAMGENGRLNAWNMRDKTVLGAVELRLPELPENYVRWGPALYHDNETDVIYLASGLGKAHDWDTYKIHVATGTVESDESGAPTTLVFTEEHEVFVASTERERKLYGFIDPEFARRPNGELTLFYTGVLHGIPEKRWHSEYIRARRMLSPNEVDLSSPTELIYDGHADADDGDPNINIDDGVAEAPTYFIQNGREYLLYSSYPSDRNQRILTLKPQNSEKGHWKRGEVILSSDSSTNPKILADQKTEEHGVGGQTLVYISEEPWLLYQGLAKLEGDKWPRFRLMMRQFVH